MNGFDENPILDGPDSYKVGHWAMVPEGTTRTMAYFEGRDGPGPITWYGLQGLLLDHVVGERVLYRHIEEAKEFIGQHLGDVSGFNEAGWDHLVRDHGGVYPLKIRAAQEGTVIPVSNVLMTVESTCPRCAWVVGYVEPVLSKVWYPTTIASEDRTRYLLIDGHLRKTGSKADPSFMYHDFGARGVSSEESAGRGGSAHLVYFKGSDTMRGIRYAQQRYPDAGMPGFSVYAMEHAAVITWGNEWEDELAAVENTLRRFPKGIVSVIADTRNWRRFLKEGICGPRLRPIIEARQGKTVCRPDSGSPPDVFLEGLQILGDTDTGYGYSRNTVGYKELPDHIGEMYGDQISTQMADRIFEAIELDGWSAGNVSTLGSGGDLLQKVDRNMYSFAYKPCLTVVNDQVRNTSKNPIDGGKRSKQGDLKLFKMGDSWRSFRTYTNQHSGLEDRLEDVFVDGELVRRMSFGQVRGNAMEGLR